MFHVTNLNNSGTGSLRDGLSVSGRRIVFDVAGTITITSALVIISNTTIDGTTAPSPGITVKGYNTSMSGYNNIIIRNIRFREDLTGPSGKCALQGTDACHTIMIDHCSIEWGRWDCMEFTGNAHDITIQYCIIGQGLDPQYFGCLIDACDRVSIHHNLWIDNNNRNPKLKGNTQYINNVVYNWGSAGGLQGGHSSAPWLSDVRNNYFIKGPSSGNDNWALDCTANDQWFQSGNYVDLDKNGSVNGTLITTAQYATLGVTLLTSQQHNPTDAVTLDAASTAVSQAASGSYGCQPLDAFDIALVNYLKSYGTQGMIGGTPTGGTATPSAPSGLTATAGNAQVSLAWSASSGATSYNVKRSTTSGGSYAAVATGITATSYVNTGLTNGTTYYYVVSAVNASGESANSAQASAKPVGPVVAQSEAGTWDSAGVLETTNAGWTGTGYVNSGNAIGAYSEVTVNVPTAGSYTIDIRFANGTTSNRPADLRINGTVVQSAVAFNGTGAWTTWSDVIVTKTLNAGNNTIRLTATTAAGCANLDKVTVQ